MPVFFLSLLTLTLTADPGELPDDVIVMQVTKFAFPLNFDPAQVDTIKSGRLLVSRDRGKTWRVSRHFTPADRQVTFTAPATGLYYFALQITLTDGKQQPEKLTEAATAMKVFVKTKPKTAPPGARR